MPTALVSKNVVQDLLQNTVALQKTNIQLLEAVQQLTQRTDKLLNLFEGAVQNLEKTEFSEPLAKQLEALLEQNKTIARGLVLLEHYIREKTSLGLRSSFNEGKPLPRV